MSAYNHCPYCNTMAEYTHRDGLPVCRCPQRRCPGHVRWLEYDEFTAQVPFPRSIGLKRLRNRKPHIWFENGSWFTCYNVVCGDPHKIEAAREFVFKRNRELESNGH